MMALLDGVAVVLARGHWDNILNTWGAALLRYHPARIRVRAVTG